MRQGETIASIALAHGFLPDTVWSAPENDALRQTREDPGILLPGDVVTLPDRRPRTVSCQTGKRHTMVCKGGVVPVCMQLLENDEPRANRPYTLKIGSREWSGQTDGTGHVHARIPANAVEGTLTLEGEPPITLRFGHLDPHDSDSGVRGRLRNLGYDAGDAAPGSEAAARLEEVIREFQADYDLKVTGQIDDATRQKLREAHGS